MSKVLIYIEPEYVNNECFKALVENHDDIQLIKFEQSDVVNDMSKFDYLLENLMCVMRESFGYTGEEDIDAKYIEEYVLWREDSLEIVDGYNDGVPLYCTECGSDHILINRVILLHDDIVVFEVVDELVSDDSDDDNYAYFVTV